MLNKVVLIGRLTRDPDVRTTTSNVSVTTFTLAVDRNYTNQQGEREADFIPIVTWRGLAETCGRYLNKGRLVAVSGRIQVRSYEGNDGQRRYITEVVADEVQFLERNPNANTGNMSGTGYPQYPDRGMPDTGGFSPLEDEDDELPF